MIDLLKTFRCSDSDIIEFLADKHGVNVENARCKGWSDSEILHALLEKDGNRISRTTMKRREYYGL
jgi:hypothetical protein